MNAFNADVVGNLIDRLEAFVTNGTSKEGDAISQADARDVIHNLRLELDVPVRSEDATTRIVMQGPRIVAEFVPQAWQNGYAIDVDPEGETEWDVTDHVLAMGKEAALAIKDDKPESDDLRFAKGAPGWVRAWNGPFYVRVEQSIEGYFEQMEHGDA